MKRILYMIIGAALGLAVTYFFLLDGVEKHTLKAFINGGGTMFGVAKPTISQIFQSATFLKSILGTLVGAIVGSVVAKLR